MVDFNEVLEKLVDDLVTEKVIKLLGEREIEKIEAQSEDLMTLEEVAKFLNLSKQTIYLKSSNNEIPCSKKGKKLYFSKSEIRAWISSGRRTTNDELKRNLVALKTKK